MDISRHNAFVTSSWLLLNFMFVDLSTGYSLVKKNQIDAQLILSIFRQPLHVSGVSRPIIRRHNRIYKAIGTYYSF